MKLTSMVFRIVTIVMVSTCLAPIASAGPKDFDRGDAPPPSFVSGKSSSKTSSNSEKSHGTHKATHSKAHKADWNYDDPSDWGGLSEDYHLCKNGKRQSPIDITETKRSSLGSIKFNYRAGPKDIINNGHTIQVNMRKGNYIVVSGKRYNLLQFHFHAPSEHTIDGKPTDLVAHFVHRASDGELGVVGVLFKACQENNTISKIWRKIPTNAGQKRKLSRKIDVLRMFPKNRGYYKYSGSLTTPPCSEGVNWMVLKNTVPVSDAQVKTFTDIIPKNVRPVQEKHHRVVHTRN